MRIPWWAKIVAKLVLSRLPVGYTMWQKLGLFRLGSMDATEYAIRVFETHTAKTGLTGQLAGKTILEIGPGDSIATAIIAAAHGARAILVDVGPFVRADTGLYIDLVQALRDQGLSPPDIIGSRDIQEILVRCNARYMIEGTKSLRLIDSASFDLIFSQAVLEHVPRREFLDLMRELRRVMKPAGVSSHQVDLRDHLGGGLNNLRFSERVWESEFFARSGFYTNRIRFSEMRDQFHSAGMTCEYTYVSRWDSLPTPKNALAPEFRLEMPEEELRVSGFHVILREDPKGDGQRSSPKLR